MKNKNKQRVIRHAIPLAVTAGIFIATTPALAAFDNNGCQSIINQALQAMQDKCRDIGRNSACYGNDQLSTQFVDSPTVPQFSLLGDVVAIKQIKSLSTSPLDQQNNTWGVALLKVQANLPDTMPGQNVTFLVYGNTTVQNTSGDMRTFYFSSGLGSPNCTEIPQEGIVVKSPDHMQVNFTANGVQIQIASTILLHAEPNKTLDVTLIEGHATVSTTAGSAILLPGQMVSVPLGGVTGIEANGPPGNPVSIDTSTTVKMASLIMAAQLIATSASPLANPVFSGLPDPSNTNVNPQRPDKDEDQDGPKDKNNKPKGPGKGPGPRPGKGPGKGDDQGH